MRLGRYYGWFEAALGRAQPGFLLAVRLYWGWQMAQTGWGKLTGLAKVVEYFTSLGIPAPAVNAYFISGLEFAGGIALALGLGSRLVALLLAGDMLVAYWAADREALMAFFNDPGKFSGAAPFTFLMAALIVLVFGAGRWSPDGLIGRGR